MSARKRNGTSVLSTPNFVLCKCTDVVVVVYFYLLNLFHELNFVFDFINVLSGGYNRVGSRMIDRHPII